MRVIPFRRTGKTNRLPCAHEIDIDTSHVNSSQQPAKKLQSPQVPRIAVTLVIIILASLALVAIFANIQRRGQIETIVVVPASSTTPPLR
jgi:hypothetical protein